MPGIIVSIGILDIFKITLPILNRIRFGSQAVIYLQRRISGKRYSPNFECHQGRKMLLPIGDNLERPNFPLATVMLIFINIAAFVVISGMDLTGSNLVDPGEQSNVQKVTEVQEFYGKWGCVPNLLQEGQLAGLLTHMFLHASIFHLIGNMLILWVFGQSLETALGGIAFVILYVFWGVVGCATHCAMDFSSEQFLIGASGSIAGVIGGYMTLSGSRQKSKCFCFWALCLSGSLFRQAFSVAFGSRSSCTAHRSTSMEPWPVSHGWRMSVAS